MGLFDTDNPVMALLSRAVDLMLLNILTLALCVPVITAGASLTAMHYAALKILRNEGSGIVSLFMRSFRRNLRQATILWLIFAPAGGILGACLLVTVHYEEAFPAFLTPALGISFLLLYMIGTTAFTLLSRFENSVGGILAGAVILTFSALPSALLILLIHILPFLLLYFVPQILPLTVLLFLSGPAIGTALIMDPPFRKMEERIGGRPAGEGEEEESSDGERNP